jgi:hypothetical protein
MSKTKSQSLKINQKDDSILQKTQSLDLFISDVYICFLNTCLCWGLIAMYMIMDLQNAYIAYSLITAMTMVSAAGIVWFRKYSNTNRSDDFLLCFWDVGQTMAAFCVVIIYGYIFQGTFSVLNFILAIYFSELLIIRSFNT